MSYRVSTGPTPVVHETRRYRVLGKRCIWGKRGEFIEKAFSPEVELSLLRAGTLELAPEVRKFNDRPLKSADKEG